MKSFRRLILVAFAAVLAVHASSSRRPEAASPPPQTPAGAAAREEAYRANNLGVALLEQFKHKEGADAFRRALGLDPKLALARTNLAIALFNVPDLAGAQKEAEAAAALSPNAPQPAYILGLIARQQNRVEDAVAAFQRVLKVDPRDVGANVNLGQLYAQQRNYPEASAALRVALEEEPYNGTALYNLGTALLRSGSREEGQRLMQQFQALRASGAATTVGTNYLEQGRYAEALVSTGAEPDVVDRRTPEVSFTDATAAAFPQSAQPWPLTDTILEQSSGEALLFDYDDDGDLDLLEVASTAQRLYRNDAGKFADVTAQSGALAKEAGGVGAGAVAGDYDNDGRPDLFVLRYGASALYHNDGGGRFSDVTAAAKIPAYPYRSKSAAFVDYDHDGDLDIFVAGNADAAETLKSDAARRERERAQTAPSNMLYTISLVMPPAPSLLLRNNGDGTFGDQSAASKLSGAVEALAVVPTDYDNRRDVDLLVAARGGVALWRNQRDGSFRDVAKEAGLVADELKAPSSVAAADINKDGFTDFYFGHGQWAGYFALSDGRGRFRLTRGPGALTVEPNARPSHHDNASQLLDYDNDGLLDLVSSVTTFGADDVHVSLRVWRNLGDGWAEVTDRAARGLSAPIGAGGGPGRGEGKRGAGGGGGGPGRARPARPPRRGRPTASG